MDRIQNTLDRLRYDFWRALCFGWSGTLLSGSRFKQVLLWLVSEIALLVVSLGMAFTSQPAPKAERRPEPIRPQLHARGA